MVRPFDKLTTHYERNQPATVRPEPFDKLRGTLPKDLFKHIFKDFLSRFPFGRPFTLAVTLGYGFIRTIEIVIAYTFAFSRSGSFLVFTVGDVITLAASVSFCDLYSLSRC